MTAIANADDIAPRNLHEVQPTDSEETIVAKAAHVVPTDDAGSPLLLFVACRKGNHSLNIALPLRVE